MSAHYKISILLPSRGRTHTLRRSLESLLNLASDVNSLELRLGFDEDDAESLDYFARDLQPWLDSINIDYHALVFKPMGYGRLNEYVNGLAANTDCDWFFFWNDDAVMQTQNWDSILTAHTGQFKLLSVHTHNDHPYSIFPIVPRAWYDTLGHLSQHQMNDAWLTQIAYVLDVFERIPIYVNHDRKDLTGNNNDLTYQARVMYEGNPNDPKDFHHKDVIHRRMLETEKLAAYMRSQGLSTDFWERVKNGSQDPWEKLRANDPNQQMKQFKLDHNNRMVPTSGQLYDFDYFTKADGIMSWKSKSLKFGDTLAALAYAFGLTWEDMVQAFKPAFDYNEHGRGESTDVSMIQAQCTFLQHEGRRVPKRVLEIGGGRGEVATALRYMGVDVVSVELGPEATKWYQATAYHYFDNEIPAVVPINKPIQDALGELDLSTFDTILMIESLEHIPEDQFEPVWQAIRNKFTGRFIVTNWPDYHPIWIGRDASPEEHCRLVDDALYDKWSSEATSVYTRRGSHLALDFSQSSV